jgi:type III pantothenate kinase
MFGARDSVDGMIRRLKREIGRNSRVIATGGFAGLMAERSTMIDSVEPELVLEGARIIFGRMKRG